jgi:hypothetical protein
LDNENTVNNQMFGHLELLVKLILKNSNDEILLLRIIIIFNWNISDWIEMKDLW